MQHFGLPTRMLDWSESFACALFFAQHQRHLSETASVWILDPGMLNQLSLKAGFIRRGQDGVTLEQSAPMPGLVSLGDDEPSQGSRIKTSQWHPAFLPPHTPLEAISALPQRINARMVSQQSCFTIMGDSFESLDEQFAGKLTENGGLYEIILPPRMFDDIEEYLELAGITPSMYYPDLEGIVKSHIASTEKKIRDGPKVTPEAYR